MSDPAIRLPTFTLAQVAQHNLPEDAWIVVDGEVFDVTRFAPLHPGGRRILLQYAGQDASSVFHGLHPVGVLRSYRAKLKVGDLEQPQQLAVSTTTTITGQSRSRGGSSSSSRSPSQGDGPVDVDADEADEHHFGDQVPFGDPLWYQGLRQPWYTASHRRFRRLIRNFVETEIKPNVQRWDESGSYPEDLPKRAYAAGVLGACFPAEYGGTRPEDFDSFHDLIFWDELARAGCGGVIASVFVSMAIALPPIMTVGSEFIKDKVCRSVITGEKGLALAITEPYAGSDVAGIKAKAVRDGDSWVLNGEKKFITAGCSADYVVVAARTGGPGMIGISLFLVEKGIPGFRSRRLKTQGWWSSNTAFLELDNVRIPGSHLIGQENQGFLPIMLQFNHERFMGMVSSVRAARLCIEEAVRYARVRRTFGKRLLDHQVIRQKLAEMVLQVETAQAAVEQFAYQMDRGLGPRRLGALAALYKVAATRCLDFCAREASQILGGASCVRGGVGGTVERIYREVRVNAIGGGSAEVMLDFAMRMSKL